MGCHRFFVYGLVSPLFISQLVARPWIPGRWQRNAIVSAAVWGYKGYPGFGWQLAGYLRVLGVPCYGGCSPADDARGDGYSPGGGLSGHQRRHAVPVRVGGIHPGVQAGQPLAVQAQPAGCVDGKDEQPQGGAERDRDAAAEKAGGTSALSRSPVSFEEIATAKN